MSSPPKLGRSLTLAVRNRHSAGRKTYPSSVIHYPVKYHGLMPVAPPPSPVSTARPGTSLPGQAMLILSALYFLARFTGLFQGAVISALLPGVATDAYFAAFDLPDTLNYLVAGGAISLTFIPIFTRFWDKGKEAEAWRFFSTLMCLMGAVLVIASVLMMVFTPQLMALSKPGFLAPDKKDTFDLAVQMTRIILPAQFFFYSGGLMLGVLNTFKRFGASGWTGAIYNVVAIVVAVPLWFLTGNPTVFAWGILVGAFVGNFVLPYLALRSAPRAQRPRFRFIFDLNNVAVRRFFVLTIPIMLGVSLPVVDWWVVGYFGSGLSEGTLTHLKNGNRLMISAQGIVGQAVAVATFPFLASMVAAGNYAEFSEFLRVNLRRLMFVTLPLSVLLVLGATPICSIIFGWGEYDDPIKIGETAVSFAFFTIGLFAWAAQGFVSRGFYALGDTRTPTIIGSALTVFFFIPLCWGAMRLDLGALGLSLATTIGAAAYFGVALIYLERKLKKRKYSAPIGLELLGGTLLRTMSACALMGLAGGMALLLGREIMPGGKGGDLVLLTWTWIVATFVFCAASAQFEIPEWSWLRAKVMRRRR